MPAVALEMVPQQETGIGSVLLLTGNVAGGDANNLRRWLASGRFVEVWLNSPGGDSDEGPLIGWELRRQGMAVRIRNGHSCASACTVAFLGGVIRTVEDGGHYRVHARSGVSNIPPEAMQRLLSAPESEIERYVLNQRREARTFVADRVRYIQAMIGGRPDTAAYNALAGREMDARPQYLLSATFAADVARIRLEGQTAAHTVIMNQERASFDEALAYLRPRLDTLGPRATHAHRMMETMFSTAIIRTADLTPEVLLKLGFVTPIIGK